MTLDGVTLRGYNGLETCWEGFGDGNQGRKKTEVHLPHNVFSFLVLVSWFKKLPSCGVLWLSAFSMKEKGSGVPSSMLTEALKWDHRDPIKCSTCDARLSTLFRVCAAA